MQAHAKLLVSGTVRGIEFRPFVYRLAQKHALAGHVSITPAGAEVEVEGEKAKLEAFLRSLVKTPPPHAEIRGVRRVTLPPEGLQGFTVEAPARTERPAPPPLLPDTALCANCLSELTDSNDRRYEYPFISCAHCGPHFTVARGGLSAVGSIALCEDCRREIEDPSDRRFRARSTGCPRCGPKIWLEGDQEDLEGGLYRRIASLLASGRILALKGVGGFVLLADARNPVAVARLRRKKGDGSRPYAVLAKDLAEVRSMALVGPREAQLLQSPERPCVVLWKGSGCSLAPGVAPGLPTVAVALPGSGLETLLFQAGSPTVLVRTSGNHAGDPPAWTNDEARGRLPALSDALILHDQEIAESAEDSLLRPTRTGALLLRRSRGWVPVPVRLPVAAPVPILAVGVGLGGSACVVVGREAYLTPHLPALRNDRAVCSLDRAARHLSSLLGATPQIIAHDADLECPGSVWSLERGRLAHYAVFHPHAHLAQVMTAAGVREPIQALVLDGCTPGPDGGFWGGEILVGDLRQWSRAAHLHPVERPGGTLVEREPWRMSFAHLKAAYGWALPKLPLSFLRDRARLGLMRRTYEGPHPLQKTTSVERLLDALAVLVGIKDRARYPGEPVLQLDARLGEIPPELKGYPFALAGGGQGSPLVVDLVPAVRAFVEDLETGRPPREAGRSFLAALAEGFAEAAARIRDAGGPPTVGLAGSALSAGCLYQALLDRLVAKGLRPLVVTGLPPGDGGLALGQAALIAAKVAGNGRYRFGAPPHRA